jgi:hypothetical protein
VKLAQPQLRRQAGARRRARARKVEQGKPPGTRRENASLEAQADLVADQAIRRMTNVARAITPAEPAKYDAPASAAKELPAELRADLDDTFGADLAAVRVHDDATAHAAARREDAQAFTAGRDIYFAQGKYEPASTEGRRLLSHEIAHVLQQTGRRLTATLIQASEREGSGEVQRAAASDPSFEATARRYGPELSRLRSSVTPGDHLEQSECPEPSEYPEHPENPGNPGANHG